MKIRLQNLSPLPRTTWVRVVVPGDTNFGSFEADSGLDSIAVKGEKVGQGTAYRIRATLKGNEIQDGTLHEGGPSHEFAYHDWITDNIPALLIDVHTILGGRGSSSAQNLLEMVSTSSAHTLWHQRSVLDSGFILEYWCEFLSGDPVVNIWGALIWSDRNDTAPDKWVDGIFIESGEYIALDFAKRNGFQRPVRVGNKWRIRLSDGIGFIDGSGIPFRGRMLAAPEGQGIDPDDPDTHNLLAALHGPVYGLALEGWDGRWLGSQNVPRVPEEGLLVNALIPYFTDVDGHIYDAREVGIGKTPGQTGEQGDFGATGGTDAVTFQDPDYLQATAHGIESDFFRGFIHYEDGVPLVRENHPRWVTWSGSTHWNLNVSPDRLGKSGGFGTGRSTGWFGYDDQHRSQNNLAAFYQLTGDPLAGLIIEHCITTDQAMIQNRIGAPRAIGRLLLCWANFKAIGFEAAGPLIDQLVQSMHEHWPGKNALGTVKILGWNQDPRLGITDDSGNDLPAWVAWEHGLAAIGLYAAWKQVGGDALRQVLGDVCTTVVKHAVYLQDNKPPWMWASAIWYPLEPDKLGLRIPTKFYASTSTRVSTRERFGGVATWTFPAVLILKEIHGGSPDHDRALSIIAEITGGQEATDVRSAEWWACVRQVT